MLKFSATDYHQPQYQTRSQQPQRKPPRQHQQHPPRRQNLLLLIRPPTKTLWHRHPKPTRIHHCNTTIRRNTRRLRRTSLDRKPRWHKPRILRRTLRTPRPRALPQTPLHWLYTHPHTRSHTTRNHNRHNQPQRQISHPKITPPCYTILAPKTRKRNIAWDGCHKIYLGLDDDQARRFEELEYPETMIPDDTYRILATWYNNSCPLRFIQAVANVKEGENPDKGGNEQLSFICL